MSKSCSIFFYEGYVGVAPTIINLTQSLNNCGYAVTIYGTETPYPYPQPENLGEKSAVVYFRKLSESLLIQKKLNFLYKLKLATLLPVLDLVDFGCKCFISTLKNKSIKSPNKPINLGIDSYGSVIALLNYYLFRQKYIYISLELNHPLSFKRFSKIIHLLERLAYKKSEFIIIQDEDRFKTLCEYTQYQHTKVFYLPNSPSSSNSLVQEIPFENYFQNIFNLNKEEFPYIILQAGVINDDVYSKELAQAFAGIHNQCALVFHERVKRSPEEQYMKALLEINSKNLFLSLEPLPYEQISKIYESATIGLAFYRDLDRNFSQISMASGKLGHYLKQGKPVLVNNLESLSRLVKNHKIGVVIQNPSSSTEIEAAIKTILSDYNFYSQNAKKCFEEEYNFTKKVKPILSFMDKL